MKDRIVKGQVLYVVPIGNLVRHYGPDARKGVVTKIGRKYIYIQIDGYYGGDEEGVRFDKNTLRGDQRCNSSWKAFYAMQEIEDIREKNRLHNELQKFFDWDGKSRELTLEQLRAIDEIIKSPEEG